MNVSESITRLAAGLATAQTTIDGLVAQLDADTGNTTIKAQLDQLAEQVTKDSTALVTLQNIERAQMRAALPIAPAILKAPREEFKADMIWRAGVVCLDAYYSRRSFDEVLRERYPDSQVTRDFCMLTLNRDQQGRGYNVLTRELLQRAAQNPAMTNVAGYAQELVHQTYAAFMQALVGVSAVAAVNFRRESFDAGSPIVVPYDLGRAAAPDNFDAAFRAEGAPIRVGRLQTGSKTLLPYSMGVIGTFTRELLRKSTPNIQELIRQRMLSDTAAVLDNVVFGSGALVAGVRPAGLLAGIDPTDTRPATATPTIADIDADLNKMVKQLVAVRMMGGPNTSWVMNRANAITLSTLTNAMMLPVYPGVSGNGGTLKGYSVAVSSYFPIDQVLLVDGDAVFMAGGVPEFEMSTEATLHEENTTPLPIGTAGAPATVAAPVRSLFQTNSAALRMVEEISWDDLRTGAIQQLTAVAW